MNILKEAAFDANYIKNHKLQPKWWKYGKLVFLIALITTYGYIYSWQKAIVLVVTLVALAAILHMMYRINTKRFTRSWLDFRVREENGVLITEQIGRYYYTAVAIIIVISILVSQLIPGI